MPEVEQPGPGGSRPLPRLGLAVVRGDSMLPTIAAGDRLIVAHGARIRPGVLVLARFADGTLAVKRAVERRTTTSGEQAWWLLSDNPAAGVDSRHRGPVPERDVLAAVLARAWPRPCRLWVGRSWVGGGGRPPGSG